MTSQVLKRIQNRKGTGTLRLGDAPNKTNPRPMHVQSSPQSAQACDQSAVLLQSAAEALHNHVPVNPASASSPRVEEDNRQKSIQRKRLLTGGCMQPATKETNGMGLQQASEIALRNFHCSPELKQCSFRFARNNEALATS